MKFTGHERDLANTTSAADDLDYMHARFYNPQVGRFLQTDPKDRRRATGQPQSWNRYGYTNGNPLTSVDPDGRETVIFIAAPSNAGDPKGLVGHAGISVTAGGQRAGVSQYGDYGLSSGASEFIRGYNSEGRDVTMYVLKTTPDQDSKMLEFIKANPDGAIDSAQSIVFQNCTTACVNILKAGEVVGNENDPGDSVTTLGFDSPKALQQLLESGELSEKVSAVVELPAKRKEEDEKKRPKQ